MATTKPGERKLQILQALAAMLEQPKGEKITTAALANKLDVSEAALYRHFASKAQMYEGLIEFIESTVFGLINQITGQQENGLAQVQAIVGMLLNFAERNPGMTRVLIGDALVNEDERLQARMNQFIDRVELAVKQSLRTAVSQQQALEAEVATRANLIVSFVIGRWHRYAKSGFRQGPSENAQAQIAFLLD
ncbi:MAG TPA: nucleoid occlusion factor SlmA [Burkholderiaceae bacterium]|nr:nucleoid occlusion factor SlmA [Burkholderiaceae bacterium]